MLKDTSKDDTDKDDTDNDPEPDPVYILTDDAKDLYRPIENKHHEWPEQKLVRIKRKKFQKIQISN